MALLCAACACAPGRSPGPGAAAAPPAIPDWVRSIPQDSTGEFVYAVGFSPRTFFAAESLDFAKNAARVELAKSIKVAVKETLSDTVVNAHRTAGNQDRLVSFSESEMDAELRGSEVVETWRDDAGLVGEKGSVYVLARVKNPNK
ncbi:MAG TPA: hypothetical protein DD417_16785 [Elusimicrobia bacterium]|nr:hypothetical protein [Elusimicrobiota bacterium]